MNHSAWGRRAAAPPTFRRLSHTCCACHTILLHDIACPPPPPPPPPIHTHTHTHFLVCSYNLNQDNCVLHIGKHRQITFQLWQLENPETSDSLALVHIGKFRQIIFQPDTSYLFSWERIWGATYMPTVTMYKNYK